MGGASCFCANAALQSVIIANKPTANFRTPTSVALSRVAFSLMRLHDTRLIYTATMQRVPLSELTITIERALIRAGITPSRAPLAARLIAETDRDGVRTHGIARLPRILEQIRVGSIDPTAEPTLVSAFGAFERWTGHRVLGNLAAYTCMARAITLANQHGIGAVALADTTHWLRGGTYGWQAADAGCAAICWTNTLPNLPPWGATTPALGNNPLIFAAPNPPHHVIVDIAMSQFSYGALSSYRERGEPLPVPGGFNAAGELTTDAAAIEQTQRALPTGFWKGSALTMVLDILAAMLSGGNTTSEIPIDPLREVGISQIFLAIAPTSLAAHEDLTRAARQAIDFLHASTPIDPAHPARYPGENTLKLREESLRLGVPVNEAQWQAVLALAE